MNAGASAFQAPPGITPSGMVLRLPPLHLKQEVFGFWNEDNPEAQCLVAPCGTKAGKSFGAAWWLVKEALATPGLYCVWISPTYLKAKIGYRYMRAMLNIPGHVNCTDGRMEIQIANNSFIKFLHGHDAEVTVEGEAVDRFVVDEAGKQSNQLWHSLLTTITQTRGCGIVTGTPRGFNWYYDVFRQAKAGDPFFVWAQFSTEDSPFVEQRAVDQAKRLLPKPLYDQYYRAMFVSMSTVFGDLTGVWADFPVENQRLWLHPDPAKRALDSCTGVDLAKVNDWTVFATVAATGETIGYCRFKGGRYTDQARKLKRYLDMFQGDKSVRYDATGVGQGVGDVFTELDIDASISGVTFTNSSKSEMVVKTTLAIERGWWKCPRIDAVEHEFSSFEVNTTRSGLSSFAAPEGEHDDTVAAFMLAVSGAHGASAADEAERFLEEAMSGKGGGMRDSISDYAAIAGDLGEDLGAIEDEDGDDLLDKEFDDLGD